MEAKRVVWLDNLRALACFMVVALHSAAPYLHQFGNRSPAEWMFANVIDSFTRACVPLFFMISGYLFLGSGGPRKRNFFRIISALIFYSAVALIYRLASGQDFSVNNILAIAVAPAFYHLWFFYALISIYILMTAVGVREGGKRSLGIVLAAMLLLNPSIFEILSVVGLSISLSPPGFLDGSLIYYLGYAILGACFRNIDLKTEGLSSSAIFISIYIISSIVISMLTYLASSEANTFDGTFYSYSNSLVILQSVALFAAVRQFNSIWPFSRTVSALSLPIYGLHALFLDARYAFGLLDRDVSAFFVLPGSLLVALAVSSAMGLLISRADSSRLVH